MLETHASFPVPLMTSSIQVSSDRSEDVQGVELLFQSSILQFYLENDSEERDIALLEVIFLSNIQVLC